MPAPRQSAYRGKERHDHSAQPDRHANSEDQRLPARNVTFPHGLSSQDRQYRQARMGDAARRVPTKVLPDWVVRLISLVDSSVAQIVPELGKFKKATNEKARRVLGWAPRPNEDAIVATAESLARLGLLRNSRKAA